MPWKVYILKCSDGSLYTGSTNNLEKRLKEHNESKRGARYTKSRRPVSVVYTETVDAIGDARRREAQIKRIKRIEKLRLIKEKKHFKPF